MLREALGPYAGGGLSVGMPGRKVNMGRWSHRTRLGSVLLLTVVTLAFLAATSTVYALDASKVTLDKESGGQPTRFTFRTDTDADAQIPWVEFAFPEGFDLGDVSTRVVILEGLVRVPVAETVTVDGTTVRLEFEPSIPPESELRVELYDVLTTNEGGERELALTYAAETTPAVSVPGGQPLLETRTGDPVVFSYTSVPMGEQVSRWLDAQTWVEQFNSVKALGLFFKPQLIAQAVPLLFAGWLLSIGLVVLAFPLAIAAGLALAFMRMSKVAPLRWIAGFYINVIRGTPLFLQIFIAFIGLRIAGVRAPDFLTGVFVLALNSSAYLAEIFRAGIQSIHKGQFEAASSLGMSYRQAMQFVVIPQTVKRVLPTMTSEFILLFKDTALLAAVGIFELMMRAQNLASRSGNLTPFIVAAVYYLIITIPLINWVGKLEERLAVSEHGHSPKTPKRRGGLFWRPVGASEFAEFEASAEVHQSR